MAATDNIIRIPMEEKPGKVRTERDKLILPYYLKHDVDACVVEFGVSKSTINRAVRNPAALEHMKLTRREAFDIHERTVARFRYNPNLTHYQPKTTKTAGAPGNPGAGEKRIKPMTVASILAGVQERKVQEMKK
jgi:hypothetical protein